MSSAIFYAGYGDMWQRVQQMAHRMPDVDAIAGVPVSGLAPAAMLSVATGVKCVSLEAVPDGIRRLLVLEDASGYAKCRTQQLGQAPGRKVYYGAVYASDAALALDLVGCHVDKPRIFTWNLTKSVHAARIAYDLDGVLCADPLPVDIDYGPHYERFLEAAAPLRKAPSQLGWIVTGRCERYRAQTERWLKAHGIRYGELVMAPDNQVHTMKAHAERKAAWYGSGSAILFVESSAGQAAHIAAVSGRPVVCTATEQAWNTRSDAAPVAVPVPVPPPKQHRRLIYTISTGAYEHCSPLNLSAPSGWDFRTIASRNCPSYLNPKQQAAWAKINGPRIFSEWEASLCIDDDMEILSDPTPLFEGAVVAAVVRPQLSTWHADLESCWRVRRATTESMALAERVRLEKAGIGNSTNWMTGVLWRRHTPEVIELCDEWAYWYSLSETQRDQPSFAVACQRVGISPRWLSEDAVSVYVKHHVKKADCDGVRMRVAPSDIDGGPRTIRRMGDR